MKKLFIPLSILTLAITQPAFAQRDFNLYFSGSAGIFQGDLNQSYIDKTTTVAQNISEGVAQHGYTGGIAFGFRKAYRQQYFLGGEWSANLDGTNASFQSGASSTSFSDATQIQYHTDITFVPGVKLTDTVNSYVKLGVSLASIQDNLTSPTGYTSANAAYLDHNKIFGYALGLGLSKTVSDVVSVFTEANYHDYGTVHFQTFQNFSTTYKHSAHIYTYAMVVGASYQFG